MRTRKIRCIVRAGNQDDFCQHKERALQALERQRGDLPFSGESVGGGELDDVIRIRGAGWLRKAGQRPRDDPVPVPGTVPPMMQNQG